MTDNVFRHFFAGFVRLHILYHAAKEPIYGAEIIEELQRHGYDISAGTLYPILHGLEGDGFLLMTSEVVGGKRRKYYRITEVGRTMLAEATRKVKELVSEVVDDKDLLAKAKKRRKT
jgi:DNA-binding PadR family transcriptional regulator